MYERQAPEGRQRILWSSCLSPLPGLVLSLLSEPTADAVGHTLPPLRGSQTGYTFPKTGLVSTVPLTGPTWGGYVEMKFNS